MAVKPEIIKARLKAKFPKANLSTKRLDAIAAKLAPMPADDADDAAVDVILDQANDFYSFEDTARDDDRMRTLEANQRATQTPAEIEAARIEAERLKNLNTPPAPDDAPSWAKSLIESNKKLAEDLEAIKTGKVIENKKQTVSELVQKSEIFKRMKPELVAKMERLVDINSETPIDEQVKALEVDYADLVQVNADNNSYAGPAGGGGRTEKYDEKEIGSIVDSI